MKKILIILSTLGFIAIGVLIVGRQGVKIVAAKPLPANATLKFIDTGNNGTNWESVPVHEGTVNLGWRLFGRYKLLLFRLESEDTLLSSGHVTMPSYGYARIHTKQDDSESKK